MWGNFVNMERECTSVSVGHKITSCIQQIRFKSGNYFTLAILFLEKHHTAVKCGFPILQLEYGLLAAETTWLELRILV